MSPGEWKNGGAGMTLRYGFHPSPFGTAIVIASGRGLAGLAFADPAASSIARRHAARCHGQPILKIAPALQRLAQRIFDTKTLAPDSRCAWC